MSSSHPNMSCALQEEPSEEITPTDDIAIRVSRLSKCYQIYDSPRDRLKQFLVPPLQHFIGQNTKQYFRDFWALKDVSFEIKKGVSVGIVGRNGAGKSTLLQIICGTLTPTSGAVETNGRVAALLELGSGFDPEFTGRENVYMNAAVLGLSKEETDACFGDILLFADIGEFIDRPVKTYSSGMLMRLAFAVAINVQPQILVVDEALAVGDVAFQRKCMRKIEELSQSGVTLLFVSHDTEIVKKVCTEAIYLNCNEVRHQGRAKEVCIEYERDLFGASNNSQNEFAQANGIGIIDNSPEIDPELLVSDEKIYGDVRARILDIQLSNIAKKKLNLLKSGMEFIVSYKVCFSAGVKRPVFGIMFTNKEGICVFGVNTAGRAESLCDYIEGDEVIVSFSLTNNLGPGIYYLTCGVHSDDHTGGLIFLQRRMDTLLFKSLGRDHEMVSGTAQLYPTIKTQLQARREMNG